MKYIVVYNPKSGTAIPLKQLKKLFSSARITIDAYLDITDDFDTSIKPYLSNPRIAVLTIGGDGTLSTVASKLTKQYAILAPLPGGTLNHFTKDIGIKQDLEEAIKNIVKAKVHEVDIASINDRYFINNSSIGLYPTSLSERSKLESQFGKWPAAVLASLKALIVFKIYTVNINGNEYKTPFIFVGNNNYDSNALFSRNSIKQGSLSVHMINTTKRIGLFKSLLLALIGRTKTDDNFISFKTKTLKLSISRRTLTVSYDGEHSRFDTPIIYKIHKKSLKVLF